MDPRLVRTDMLVGLVRVSTKEDGLDFATARHIAQDKARETLNHPMLLAWFDKHAWSHSPPTC